MHCCFGFNRLHFTALVTWLFSMFFATQILFTIFGNYTPPWRCASSNSVFTRDCALYHQCLASNSSVEFEPAYFHSAALEFEWVCSAKQVYLTTAQFIGVFFGAIIFSVLSDRFGRRPVSVAILAMGIPVLLASGFVPGEGYFFAARFLVGMNVGGTLVVIYTLTMELLRPEQRLPQRAFFNWGLARLMLTAVCFVFPDWRQASIASALISLPAILSLVFLLPESPTWLNKSGKSAKLGVCCNVVGSENLEKASCQRENASPGRQWTILELVKNRPFLQRISVLWVMFFLGTLSGYLTDLNSSNLSGNLFVGQALFPGLIAVSKMALIVYTTLNSSFSRRNLHQYAQAGVILNYATLALVSSLWSDWAVLILILNLLGTVFIEYTWDANYLCAVELMPTEVRATAVGSCSTMGRLGMILSPTLLLLNTVWSPSVYVLTCVMGCLNLAVSYKWLVECKDIDLNEVSFEKRKEGEKNLSSKF